MPVDLRRFDAVLFDLDGVITDTAAVHAAAWKQLFDDFLRARSAATSDPFVEFDLAADYREYVDGKPRYEGVRSFLASRGIELPFGDPDDPPGDTTICALGNIKNLNFNKVLRRDGAKIFDTTVELIRRLKADGVRVAVVSSSKNTPMILEVAGLTDLFEQKFDGNDAQRLGLKGKPTPDTYQKAADLLGVPYREGGRRRRCDLRRPGREGRRVSDSWWVSTGTAKPTRCEENGADVVVSDMGELL